MQLRKALSASMPNRGSMRSVAGASLSLQLFRLQQRIRHDDFLVAMAFAAVAYDLEADRSESLHAKGIDNASQQRRTVLSNLYDDASPASLIAHNHAGAERKRLVRSRNAHVVVQLSGCRSFCCIGGGITAFGGRLARRPCCCKQHSRMKTAALPNTPESA